jgi:hypothetical protein
MKRILVTQIIVGMLAGWAVAASAAPNDPPQVNQNQGASAVQAGAVKDKRIITPDMDARERVEAQRAIQKRAAANRNKLMMEAAEKEKKQPAPKTAIPNQPGEK